MSRKGPKCPTHRGVLSVETWVRAFPSCEIATHARRRDDPRRYHDAEEENGRRETVNGRRETVNGRRETVNGRRETVNGWGEREEERKWACSGIFRLSVCSALSRGWRPR